MTGLALDALRVTLPGAPPLGPISLRVAPGEVVAILGPSGAGKTTLLRAIAGLIPSEGSIMTSGRDVGGLPPEQRNIVYLHQTPRLFPHLDVHANVAFPLVVRGVPRDAARRRANELLAAVQLGPLASRRVAGLSGGERQRVALARAMAAAPTVLLLDEPFAALDPGLRAELRELVANLVHTTATATVLVTHDFEDATDLARTLGVLLGGRLAQLDEPEELFARPATLAVASFLELPNRWDVGVVRDWLGPLPPDVATVALPVTGARLTSSDNGAWAVARILPTRTGLIAEVSRGDFKMRGIVDGARPMVGTTVDVRIDRTQLLGFDAAGRRLTPG